ncbi:hypothetical protein ACXZ66_03150 [Corynebacterium sp. S7]
MTAYGDMKSHKTPIPTPTLVRGIGSILIGASVAIMVGPWSIGLRVGLAGTAAVLAIVLTLLHPYRREMKYFALANNVDTFPTIGQIVPLMVWWLLLMLAPVLAPWPLWGVVLVFIAIAGVAWVLYPHVDGTRKLAYA